MNFLDFLAERVKNPDEKKDPFYRTLKKVTFNRNKARIQKGRERARDVMPSEKTLKIRARKNARRFLALKFMGKRYDAMSDVEREQFSKKLKAQKALFDKVINQYLILLRRKAREKTLKQK